MNTRMQFDTMEKALPFVAELLDCQAVKDYKAKIKAASKDKTIEEKGNGEIMQMLMPIFLREKRETVFGLLGAISDKTPDEIAEQDWTETQKLLNAPIISDLCDFFIFSVRMVRNA